MMRFRYRRVWLLAGMLAAMALAACENPGLSGRDAELARVRAEKGFAVIEATAERAVFAVRGQRIVVEPPQGYCLDEDSVAVTRNAAFALVAARSAITDEMRTNSNSSRFWKTPSSASGPISYAV